MSGVPWLSILTLLPLVAAVAAWLANRSQPRAARVIALSSAFGTLAGTGWLWLHFDSLQTGYQMVNRGSWIPSLGVEYHLGVDGLSLTLLALTGIVVLMALTATPRNVDHPGLYYALVLCLQAGLYGTFTALNFFHWFLFWEVSLIPAFFLIKLWGGPRRSEAALRFFVYTMVGSVGLLLTFVALFLATGTFDFTTLTELARDGALTRSLPAKLGWPHLSADTLTTLLFLGAFLGFAVKVPLPPFHGWLPLAYAEASPPVTMLLTGVMSKMGVYGFLRILLPIFPEPIQWYSTPLLILAVAGVILPAAAALAQNDLKRVFAYSSINHLSYCALAVFASGAVGSGADRAAALSGAMFQMFNHGLTAAALFWFIAVLEQRADGLRDIRGFGGLREIMPVFTGLIGFALFSSLGLPGLNGFIGEFLIFKGAFGLAPVMTAFASVGLLLTALFILRVLQRVFWGPLNPAWASLPDLTTVERLQFAPVIAAMILLGVWPQLLLGPLAQAVLSLTGRVSN